MSKALPPLFTTLPLQRSPPSPMTQLAQMTSSTSTSDSPLSTHMSVPGQPYCTSPASYEPTESLSFPKMPVASCSSTVNSTDSECLSDLESRIQSPSLLSCLFAAQTPVVVLGGEQTRSSSSSYQPTPISPSHTGGGAAGAKPILRRDTGNMSDDPHLAFRAALMNGFNTAAAGAAPFSGQESEATSPKSTVSGVKRSCTLKFAVRPPSRTDSISPSKDRKASAGRQDKDKMWMTPARVEKESDDEGYQEDSEGGFTSDEDAEVGLGLISPRRDWRRGKALWPGARTQTNHSASASAFASRHPADRSIKRVESSIFYVTEPDEPSARVPTAGPSRGRSVSIAAGACKTVTKCSRHLSPPPRPRSPSPLRNGVARANSLRVQVDGYAPPAARSPSAFELCRRRGSGQPRILADAQCRTFDLKSRSSIGWKSDDSAFLARPTTSPRRDMMRKASLPESVLPGASTSTGQPRRFRSILRTQSASPLVPAPTARPGAGTSVAAGGEPPMGRRGSAPTIFTTRGALWKLEPMSVIAPAPASPALSMGSAKEGLQRALGC